MIGRIILVCLVALIMYVIVPEFSGFIFRKRQNLFKTNIDSKKGISGRCIGITGKKMRIRTSGNEILELLPKKTVCLLLWNDQIIEEIRWNSILLVEKGIPIEIFQSTKNAGKTLCVLHSEDYQGNVNKISAEHETVILPQDHIKLYSIAIGVFLEFLLFYNSISQPGMENAAIAALLGLFGKALPYCPPGLFLTLPAHKISLQNRKTKRRARTIYAALLVTGGIALNIVLIYIVIRATGFTLN